MLSQPGAPLLAFIVGAVTMVAGECARRAYIGRARRMMNSYTVIGYGGRVARRSRPLVSAVAWALMLGGLALCGLGIWSAFLSG